MSPTNPEQWAGPSDQPAGHTPQPPPLPQQPAGHPPSQGQPGQPGYPNQGQGQPGYPNQGQPGYPNQGQPGYPPSQGQPGQPGYPPNQGQPGYPPNQGQPGYPPFPPAPKKKRTGLVIGLGAGALVLVIVIVAAAILVPRLFAGPTLTSAQFAKIFAEGDTLLGTPISQRSTALPTAPRSTDACTLALVAQLSGGEEWMAATAGTKASVVGARYTTPDAASKAFANLKQPCNLDDSSGVVENATYQTTKTSDGEVLIVRRGNVLMLGGAGQFQRIQVRDFAQAIAKEINASS